MLGHPACQKMLPEIIDNRSRESQFDILLSEYLAPVLTDFRLAVGYFFLSGLKCILPGLRKNPAIAGQNEATQPLIRVLMSPVTDVPTGQSLAEGYEARRQRVIRAYDEDLAKAGPEEARFLVDLLKRGLLEVRLMTGALFHAKAYLIRIDRDGQLPQYFSFVGSSNFSEAGLTGNRELNLPVEDSKKYQALRRWFDELWEKESQPFNKDLLQLIEKSGALEREAPPQKTEQALSPFEMVAFLGRHYFGVPSAEELSGEDLLAEFQHIGAENIAYKLERFGGAIVADSVGLGKTFTAGEVVRREYQREGKILLILPPHLMEQWRSTLAQYFRLPEKSEMVQFLSQGKLSFMTEKEAEEIGKREKFSLIVIDEAHRARNHNTQLYRNIQRLHPPGSRAKILLLTATPFNNSVEDLKNLINLITVKEALINAGLKPNAFEEFSRALRQKKSTNGKDPELEKSCNDIREILKRVMLLRMRSTIKARYQNIKIAGKPLAFFDPKVEKKHYRYDASYREMFEALPDFISSLNLPHIVLSNKSGQQLGALFQVRLFKRIESSLYAFYVSLQNVVQNGNALREKINNGGLEQALKDYSRKLREQGLFGPGDEEYAEEIDEYLMEQGEGESEAEFRPEIRAEDVLVWIEEDNQAIGNFIKKYLEPRMQNPADALTLKDDKIDIFLGQLVSERWSKALIFTEFKATAEYLEYRLQEAVKTGKLNIRFAVTTSGDKAMAEKLDRFAPMGRGKNIPPDEQLHLLISTDVLAEGVNLQDTDLLINYDLPWNPMRIVQRVGRANRIGSERAVRVVNFIPDDVLENFLKLVKILESKIRQVALLLGKEMAILSSAEEAELFRAEDIGEEIKKVRAVDHVRGYEEVSRRNPIFDQLSGEESEEDFFRFRLFHAMRSLRLRVTDFAALPSSETQVYAILRKEEPQNAYALVEVYGKYKEKEKLLRRVWIDALSGQPVYP
ncbi:MAG: SNF2-related protein, partial [Turneriella sp.]|nr:SNF2-related protein [Turneriella sp.]